MTLQYSVTVRNAKLDAVETATGTAARLLIYSGSPPVTCATAASGTLLCTIVCPSDWMNNASGGTKTLLGSWTASAGATGTAGYFRILDSSVTTCHAQGTVGTSATDMIVDSVSFTSGQTFTVTSFTLTAGNA